MYTVHTWSRKTLGWPQCGHASSWVAGRCSMSSQAGRPPTLLGKCLLSTSHDSNSVSRKPRSTVVAPMASAISTFIINSQHITIK